MKPAQRPTILCVDDEDRVLDGLALTLGRQFDVVVASGGQVGLEQLRRQPAIQVVVSDMRMPGMNGAEFLGQVRREFPDVTRMLLTGESGIQNAIAAVNDGQIFRFLQKPCHPEDLHKAVDAAVRQHRLLTTEKRVLDETLRGAIAAMADLLCLVDPVAFGKTLWIRRYVADLCTDLGVPNRWQLDVAATVCQLGTVTLGKDTTTKLRVGADLTAAERSQVDALPSVVSGLLSGIPRLEPVLAILAELQRWNEAGGTSRDLDAQILRVTIEFDALRGRGMPSGAAIAMLNERRIFDPSVLNALADRRRAEERLSPAEAQALALSESLAGEAVGP